MHDSHEHGAEPSSERSANLIVLKTPITLKVICIKQSTSYKYFIISINL